MGRRPYHEHHTSLHGRTSGCIKRRGTWTKIDVCSIFPDRTQPSFPAVGSDTAGEWGYRRISTSAESESLAIEKLGIHRVSHSYTITLSSRPLSLRIERPAGLRTCLRDNVIAPLRYQPILHVEDADNVPFALAGGAREPIPSLMGNN